MLVYFKDGKKIVCLFGVCVFCSYGLRWVSVLFSCKYCVFYYCLCFSYFSVIAQPVIEKSAVSNSVEESSKPSASDSTENVDVKEYDEVIEVLEVENCVGLWLKNGYFGSRACDSFLEKPNMPESTVFYINQAYWNIKDEEYLN